MVKNTSEWGREKARKRFQDGGGVVAQQRPTMADLLKLPANHPTFDESKDTGLHYRQNISLAEDYGTGTPKARRSPKLKGPAPND